MKDLLIAKHLQLLAEEQSKGDETLAVCSRLYNGVLYLSVVATDNETFLKSHGVLEMLSGFIGGETDKTKEWCNQDLLMEFLALKPFLLGEIEKHDKTPIVISGHGVGGSLALIAGYYLTMKHMNLLRVVTFGAPPALNTNKLHDGFKYPLKCITAQYTLKKDPMPKMFRWTNNKSLNNTALPWNLSDGDHGSISNYCKAMFVKGVVDEH